MTFLDMILKSVDVLSVKHTSYNQGTYAIPQFADNRTKLYLLYCWKYIYRQFT